METGIIKENYIISKFDLDTNSIPVTSLFYEGIMEGSGSCSGTNKSEHFSDSNRIHTDLDIAKIKEKVIEQENYISYLKSLLIKQQKNIEDAG